MAKKNLNDETNAETQDEAVQAETVQTETQGETVQAETLGVNDVVVGGGEVIEPTHYAVTLRAIHPLATYGRCGYRFSKDAALEIPAGDLTGEQIVTLAEDPWLEFVPVCDE